MQAQDISGDLTYRVVINVEEQFSLWLAERVLPEGWRDAGYSGSQEQCLAFIDQTWQDLRPLSLRQSLAVEGGVQERSNELAWWRRVARRAVAGR